MTYHSYIFFSVRPSFHKVSVPSKTLYKKAFLREIINEKKVIIQAYTTLGLKTNTTFALWMQAESVEAIQELLNRLLHTKLGTHLKITYTLFGLIRQTQYSSPTANQLDTGRKGGRYLIIYPFTKTYEWYTLPLTKRKALMNGHIQIGRKYPQITQLLLYSYGVDDQEFIVSYETDDLSDFQSLVIDLRSDKVRAYTFRDTPIFTCIYRSFAELMQFI